MTDPTDLTRFGSTTAREWPFFHCRGLTPGRESGSIRSSPTSQVMHRPKAATLKNLPPCRFVEKDEWLARRICRVRDSANPNRISPSFNYLSN